MYPSPRLSSWELFRPRRRKSHLRTGKYPPKSLMGRNRTQLACIHEEEIKKSSDFFQRVTWEILDRSIFVLVNKIKNTEIKNIPHIKNQLIYLNMINGKGLLCRYIIQAQLKSTNNTHKYALLASLVNCEFSEIGMLLLRRCVHIFFCGYRSQTNDRLLCFPILKLIAHLINYSVGDPILAVELVKLLLKSPTEESVNMAYSIIHICGHKMRQMYSAEMDKIADTKYNEDKMLDSAIEFKLSYTISHVIKTNKYSVVESPDLIPNETHIHLLKLDSLIDSEEYHDYYFHKPECENDIYRLYYEQFILKDNNKAVYLLIYDTNDGYNYFSNGKKVNYDVNNNTENMRLIKELITQIIMNSSFDYITSALQLMQLKMKPGQETELCGILLDFCSKQNINNDHLERLGHVTQILCQLDEFIVGHLERMFVDNYLMVHNFNIKQVRNVSTFYAHLLYTDTINWDVMSVIQLTKATVVSSNVFFIKCMFYEFVEHIGYKGIVARIYSEFTISTFEGIFLGDESIDIFASMGLDGLIALYLDCRDSIKYY